MMKRNSFVRLAKEFLQREAQALQVTIWGLGAFLLGFAIGKFAF